MGQGTIGSVDKLGNICDTSPAPGVRVHLAPRRDESLDWMESRGCTRIERNAEFRRGYVHAHNECSTVPRVEDNYIGRKNDTELRAAPMPPAR